MWVREELLAVVVAVLVLSTVQEAEGFVGWGSGIVGGALSYLWWIFLGTLAVSLYMKKLLRYKERRRWRLEAEAERQQEKELLEALKKEAAKTAIKERENAKVVKGKDTAPFIYGALGPVGEDYRNTEPDPYLYNNPFVAPQTLPQYPDYWPDEDYEKAAYDSYRLNTHFHVPHRLRRSPEHLPDEGRDDEDTEQNPDQHEPLSMPHHLPHSLDDLPDKDEQDEGLEKVLMNLATYLDTSGCSVRLLCHLQEKSQGTRTQDEEHLLHLFVGSHSDAPLGRQCGQDFPRCILHGEELNAMFTFTSSLMTKIL